MTQLTNGTGFLNPDGEIACQPLRDKLREILATQDDEIHLRSLGSTIQALVANEISIAMQRVRQAK